MSVCVSLNMFVRFIVLLSSVWLLCFDCLSVNVLSVMILMCLWFMFILWVSMVVLLSVV